MDPDVEPEVMLERIVSVSVVDVVPVPDPVPDAFDPNPDPVPDALDPNPDPVPEAFDELLFE